jgi:hypothetical protein
MTPNPQWSIDHKLGWNEAIAAAVEKLEAWKAAVTRKQRGQIFPDPRLEEELICADVAIRYVWGLRKP